MIIASIIPINESASFKLPENAERVMFITDLNLRPNKNLDISISKCTIGHAFFVKDIRLIYINKLGYLLKEIPEDSIVNTKDLYSNTNVVCDVYDNGKLRLSIFNEYTWISLLPKSQKTNSFSTEAGKNLYLLKNTDYRCLSPPLFEEIFLNSLKYFEENELYEMCNLLKRFSLDWFTFYETHYEDLPELIATKGWSWLYELNCAYK